MAILHTILGLTALLAIAVIFSNNRRQIPWKIVGIGLGLQLLFALFVLKTSWGQAVFDALGGFFVTLIDFTKAGSEFIFGPMMDQSEFGFIFAIQVLPTVIFFAALMGVLYHLGIMQRIVQGMAKVMVKILGTSGAESLSVAANVFIGQTEAPLVVRPYIARMTQSELFVMMVGGMATIAGGVLAAYVGLLGGDDPAQKLYFAKHLLSASIMAAPATFVIARILIPETEDSMTRGVVRAEVETDAMNVIEAAANGAGDGVKLALNIGGMLLAFLALIAMIDYPLNALGELLGMEQTLSLSLILGWILSPIAWLIGVPWTDAITIGGLIGQKVVANEFVAYVNLSEVSDQLLPQSQLIATYALCGFANFSSIAIQIGGIGGIAPNRKSDIARLGLKAVLGGSLATMMTATIAGALMAV